MAKITVGILRGGPSSEYDVSLKTGENVLRSLPEGMYKGIDIFISRDGEWHHKGIVRSPETILRHVDVAFNAMHGEYGEDGTVQKILERHAIPYTGSDAIASRFAMKKNVAKELLSRAGLKVLPSILVKPEDDVEDTCRVVHRAMAPPWVVKPAGKGSSVGVSIVRTLPNLADALTEALRIDSAALVEKYINGREATCGVLENFREETYYALPVIEIIPPKGKFFDYQCKYDGSTQEICPGRFSPREKTHIQDAAIRAHKALGCRHYSRTDMMLANDTVWVLEINTLPGLTSESLLPKSAEAIGLSFPALLDHIVRLAIKK
ncbi:MAG: D-alanine--D-alanine ligase [Candidatus Niyogibacteria bacterium CG10_big_fil_rev_8_21_14_0_10_46_36]|uniref:D-alanine--D-alanine ligase n=1 Tax=Candidatus Niyogibacteria bacterium CG10_big_fil_rev_8_21_14_0_10_46_36 TaxID=1974726 RepID=A0A2H0TCZ3_9BACT|nr:MAG: D-alanine--D-alanine ligase [Candidatus Niyogibacteria bacterium CG10_big_fil_rev_8_21_14_0_10_46_36]